MTHFHLHLLFWRSISMSNYADNTTKLHPNSSIIKLSMYATNGVDFKGQNDLHFPKGSRHDWRVIQLEWNRPGDVQRRSKLTENHVPKNPRTIVIILV